MGTTTQFWADTSRPDLLTEDPDDPRQVPVQLWYPAEGSGEATPYMPDLDLIIRALRIDPTPQPDRLPVDPERLAAVRPEAIVDAPITMDAGPFPLIVLSPGGNVSRHWHSALAQDLASRGYVVAVVSHAHSGFDFFPVGGLLRSHPRWDPEGVSADETERLDQELTDLLAGDARFVLDRLTSQPVGQLAGRVDFERVAIVGHSRGGSTVSRTCATDARFDACVIYDNVGSEPERTSGLEQPMMTIRASGDGWPDDRVERVRRFLAKTASWAVEVVIEGAGHFSFTDLPLIDPNVFPSRIDPRRAHHLVADYTARFLDIALDGGRPDDWRAGVTADSEVTVEVFESVR